ncbi:MAG: hypothetical protein E5V16_11350, partial [Mesorhizobium sp.]
MTKVIRNGTIVTADRTWKADLLMQHGKIVAIGSNLHGDNEFDGTGCYVMPGGIDPHTHLEMPFMGTYSADDFESGTRAALAGGTTMVVDFCLPSPQQSLLEALQMWDNKTSKASCDYSFHMAITWWGKQVFDEMADVVDKGITSFKHFMAYKGALMVDDDEMYSSFQRCADLGALPLVHAENGDVVAALSQKLLAAGNNGPEGHAYSRPPEVEGEATNRAIMIADMAGVPMPVRDAQEERREKERASLTEIMEMATAFFQERLQGPEGAKARAYLRDRGLTPATQQSFRLGYAPDSRNALKEHLAAKGVPKADIEACGLVRHGDDVPVSYDWFRDRIMFPIPDSRGKIIAFGGRALAADALAKYMNSPDTELFHKGNVLYNFARARQALGKGALAKG